MSQDDACLGRNKQLTWKKVLSEHCLHRDSDRGLFWQYFSYIWKSSRCKGSRKASHTHARKPAGQPNKVNTQTVNLLLSLLPTLISKSHRVWVKKKKDTAGNHSRPQRSHDCCSPPSAAGHAPTLPALVLVSSIRSILLN